MATYIIDGVFFYIGNSGTITFDSFGSFPDSPVFDSQPDTVFSPGDPDGSGGNIVGSFTIPLSGGGTIELLAATDGFDTVLFIPDGMVPGDFLPPATLDYFTVNTADYPQCFARDTKITTPGGEVAVQDLQIGDTLITADGATTRVKWVGRKTIKPLWAGPKSQPVRIRAGALGNGLPHSELTVTADHGMVFYPSSSEAVGESKNDGFVINASALVNGDTIDFVSMSELEDNFIVYHIETEAHDVILANGAPSETFIDAAGRAAFDNHQEYLDLYGAERIIPAMPMPRISSSRLLPQLIRSRLSSSTRHRTLLIA